MAYMRRHLLAFIIMAVVIGAASISALAVNAQIDILSNINNAQSCTEIEGQSPVIDPFTGEAECRCESGHEVNEKGTKCVKVEITTCPSGEEKNIFGECIPIVEQDPEPTSCENKTYNQGVYDNVYDLDGDCHMSEGPENLPTGYPIDCDDSLPDGADRFENCEEVVETSECPEGQEINPNGACVPVIQETQGCPEGEELNPNGACVPVVTEEDCGTELYNVGIYNNVYDLDGDCHMSEGPENLPTGYPIDCDDSLPDGADRFENCEEETTDECPDGTHLGVTGPNDKTPACVPDEEGCEEGFVVVPGYSPNGLPITTCIEEEVGCPDGTHLGVTGPNDKTPACVPNVELSGEECAEGEVLLLAYDENGVPVTQCVTQCEIGTTLQQTQVAGDTVYTCVEVDTACTPGQVTQFSQTSITHALLEECTNREDVCTGSGEVAEYSVTGLFLGCNTGCPDGQIVISYTTDDGLSYEECANPSEDDVCDPNEHPGFQSTSIIVNQTTGEGRCLEEDEDICEEGQVIGYTFSGLPTCVDQCADGEIIYEWTGKDGEVYQECYSPEENNDEGYDDVCEEDQVLTIQSTNVENHQIIAECLDEDLICEEGQEVIYDGSGLASCADRCENGEVPILGYDPNGLPTSICVEENEDICEDGEILGYDANGLPLGDGECVEEEEVCADGEILVHTTTGYGVCQEEEVGCPAGYVAFYDGSGALFCEVPEAGCVDGQVSAPVQTIVIQQANTSYEETIYSCYEPEDACTDSESGALFSQAATTGLGGCQENCPAGQLLVEAQSATGEPYLTCESPIEPAFFQQYSGEGNTDDDEENQDGQVFVAISSGSGADADETVYVKKNKEEACPAGTSLLLDQSNRASCVRECPVDHIRTERRLRGTKFQECVPLTSLTEREQRQALRSTNANDKRVYVLVGIAIVLVALLVGLFTQAKKKEEIGQ
ncbi:MAG: hypothetical protein HN726_01715 [Candidatus Magasanikbacteria bacterium]|jgi:hypothetical protein|nr:hypothetical protein [Candidatus Magasanikbacteria bacterium]